MEKQEERSRQGRKNTSETSSDLKAAQIQIMLEVMGTESNLAGEKANLEYRYNKGKFRIRKN